MFLLSLKTWLTTCIVGSVILFVGLTTMEHGHIDLDEAGIILAIGFAASLLLLLPAMIGFGLLGKMQVEHMKPVQAKTISTVYGLGAILISFVLLGLLLDRSFGSDTELYFIPVPYMLAFTGAVWLYRWPAAVIPSDHDLLATQEFAEAPALPFPQKMVYTIAVLEGGLLLFDLIRWAILLPHAPGHNIPLLTYHLLSMGALAAGIYLLLQRRSLGWKLLALFITALVFNIIISNLINLRVYLQYLSQLAGVLLPMLLALGISVVSLALLLRQSVMGFFRISRQDAIVLVLAGCALSILQTALTRWFFGAL